MPKVSLFPVPKKSKSCSKNLQELHEMAQEALEDAVLMGCTEAQVKDYLRVLMDSLENPYAADWRVVVAGVGFDGFLIGKHHCCFVCLF